MAPGSRRMVLVVAAVLLAGCGRTEKSSLKRQPPAKARSEATMAATVQVSRAEQPVANQRALEWESREARMASMKLAEDLAAMRQELDEARERIRQLEEDLGAAHAALDRQMVEAPGEAVGPAQSPAAAGMQRGEVGLVDVNEDLNLVVLDAGGADGIMAGMQFSIVRQKKVIGRVRVVDVREEIAGAVVENAGPGKYPRKGDVAVLWNGK